MFLLDTNVLSHASKPAKKQNHVISNWLKNQASIAIPFPVLLEIQQGIIEVGKEQPVKATALTQWLDHILEGEYHYPEATPAVARTLAEMNCCRPLKHLWYVNEQAKDKKPGMDLFIAAMSIVHDIPIATLDVWDFVCINKFFPLPGLYDPSGDTWIIVKGAEDQFQRDMVNAPGR
ncbi:hypothetical protein ASG25_20675 [Rhizobium sp. Leaf384]|uniref:hypothetical protein n=1 Tax=Rhizobium sp. Leaf384 TaxID=1736358 RepID=UPI000713F9B2|nr:hypothetical protein [Rhizobium sp. Leaf384]KQS75177.1 hypothetical protein ASG25_20675 [Rhizobium sp. Leaf384]